MIRKVFVFFGIVQGVGFRWRAMKAAELCGCTGWVRNEWDGSVTMEIQGDEAQIDETVKAIARSRYIRIDNMRSRLIPPVPEERGFHAR